jgi:ribosome maturation factor RimP
MINVYSNPQERAVVEQVQLKLEELGFTIVKLRIREQEEVKNCSLSMERLDEKPVNIQDCRLVYRCLQNLIEEETLSLAGFSLEVGSPGINRPLTRRKDYVAAIELTVKIQTLRKIDNKRNFKGCLKGVSNTEITLVTSSDNKTHTIGFGDISEAYLKTY